MRTKEEWYARHDIYRKICDSPTTTETILTMEKQRYTLFSNGTEFMFWYECNCARCVKAVSGEAKYRCAIQKHIELACVTDGTGNKRDYEATRRRFCPYLQTERKPRHKKKEDSLQLKLL